MSMPLLAELLEEQQSMSAVETFADRHDGGELPAMAERYEQLIPLGRSPQPGQQLAFRVDLDACTGCKACVTACHSLNGLAEDETWREVGLVLGAGGESSLQQTVTTACHHCEDPACANGCPVRAYEKDPVTGIVRHLDDQCIGCQYCTLTCPYDVPSYSAELGIVRKCDMCAGRLADGEAPACVQGCPNGAISIEIVDTVGAEGARELLPGVGSGMPASTIARPTTRYVSKRDERELRPADAGRVAPAPAHDPLAAMLVCMQLSVGLLFFEVMNGDPRPTRLALAALAGALGLGAATLHLGRPLLAFRAFLGLRRSWMSREIVVFGAYLPALGAAVALPALVSGLAALALGLGIVGTACSMMIYASTQRPYWALPRTVAAFLGTALALGAVASGWLALGLWIAAAKLAWEIAFVARSQPDPALERSRVLLRGVLRARLRTRVVAGLAGLVLGAAALATSSPPLAVAALLALLLGELLERHLYFSAEARPGMPGS